ncbi:hypothetical protein U8P80_01760 [Rhizobium beringeri]|jgi:hypothetical protein|nr:MULTISPECIES: hypothetical protein [Rhizobium]WSG74600.1 hypothetical protein U8P80_01760 [Rhizobium beringeri]WSG89252.1 hypothetical protein U8P73_01590 [Rhizobium beringeri]WSH14795.1 hypothetical protein U8P74_01760 [Rhizobium beringeri]WSH27596.1 hypothetical protein U8P75_01700 [Rhizobium beringeri]WSH51410.1 hypothetical protein U8Q06_01720 [Rhizobium beringeri]
MKIDGDCLRQRAPPADYSVDTAGGEHQVADLCVLQNQLRNKIS